MWDVYRQLNCHLYYRCQPVSIELISTAYQCFSGANCPADGSVASCIRDRQTECKLAISPLVSYYRLIISFSSLLLNTMDSDLSAATVANCFLS